MFCFRKWCNKIAYRNGMKDRWEHGFCGENDRGN